jgi:hypothetical protein
MTPMLEAYHLAQVIYWVAMVPIAVYVLYLVSGYFTGEPPTSLRRAFLTVVGVAAAVYFTYDAAGYLFVRMAEDPSVGFQLPPGFTYWDWFHEPFAIKWYVLGFIPFIRFLPIVFALCVGGILFVLIWSIPWREAAVLFLAQLFLDVLAMMVLSFVIRMGLVFYERTFAVPAAAVPGAGPVQQMPDPRQPPPDLYHLHQRVRNLPPGQGSVWRRLDADWESFNGKLAPLYGFLRPVTQHLPRPAQDFLESGGWPLVLVGLVALGLLWPRVHRKRKHHRRPKHHLPHQPLPPRDRLSLIGDALTGLGARQATVRGVPARLRLVVLSAVDPASGPVTKDAAAGALEAVRPGLAEVAGYDVPRVEVWPGLQPHGSFRQALESDVEVPEPAGRPSRWVLVVGTTNLGERAVHVGLGLYANEATTQRVIEVQQGKWAEVLDLRTVPAAERGD